MAEQMFQVGDRVIVTGDTMRTYHSIDAGSEAVILKFESDGFSPEYLTSVQHTPEQALDMASHDSDDHEFWGNVWVDCEVEWVGEADLKPNEEPAFTLHKIEADGSLTDMTKFFSDVSISEFSDLPVDEIEDVVNHPAHYTSDPSGVECITVTRHRNFNIGNAMKYLWRAGLKDADTHTEDLRKAIWYINDEIERLEGGDG